MQTFTDGTSNNITIIATGYTTDKKYFENWIIDGKLSKQDQKLLYLDFLVGSISIYNKLVQRNC